MNIIRGFQDSMPRDMEKRRQCENTLIRVFQEWGYEEIDTPTLEYYDVLAKGIGPDLKGRMFKFLNSDGEIIVLRPDMTTPIARVAATKLNINKGGYHKLYYLNPVFRKINTQTEDQQEFHQAGIELLGLNNRISDAEVIAVAIQGLMNSGLREFYLDIGSAKFFNSVMDQLPLNSEQKGVLRKTVMSKDFVLLESQLSGFGLSKYEQDLVLCLPHWRGDEEVIAEAEAFLKGKNESALIALREVEEVYQYLKLFGMGEYTLIDLGMIRNFDYYTGIIFEGYTTQSGSAICGGGRYDLLCQKFGRDIPSTGIAIGIERLLGALYQGENLKSLNLDERKYFIRFPGELTGTAFGLAEKLRQQGYLVEMELSLNRSKEKALKYALDKNIRFIIEIRSEDMSRINRYDLQTRSEERISYESIKPLS